MRLSCFALLVLTACSEPTAPTDGGSLDHDGAVHQVDAGVDAGGAPPSMIGPADRRAQLVVPNAYDGVTPLPAIVLLHGYGASGELQDLYFGLSRAARTAGFYVIIPDGTLDSTGKRFWNATDYCCDFGHTNVDDVAYLTSLVDELESLAPVSQLYFVGHSNGGFMSYRMACELADRVSAIVSLAGSDYWDASACVPDRAVSVLQIHGDADAVVPDSGTTNVFPGAEDVVARWAMRAGCDTSASETGDPIDLETNLAGAETAVTRYASGCSGAQAELWTIHGGSHIPALTPDFTPDVLAWLGAHAR